MSTLEQQVHEKAHLAVDQLQERAGGRLDYSEASFEAIEDILDEAAQYADRHNSIVTRAVRAAGLSRVTLARLLNFGVPLLALRDVSQVAITIAVQRRKKRDRETLRLGHE